MSEGQRGFFLSYKLQVNYTAILKKMPNTKFKKVPSGPENNIMKKRAG
jgi:hypothetical protein